MAEARDKARDEAEGKARARARAGARARARGRAKALAGEEAARKAPASSKEEVMSTIKVIELIGTSNKNWEDAASSAVKEAQETVSGITGLEVIGQTARVENGVIKEFRATVKVAFLVEHSR